MRKRAEITNTQSEARRPRKRRFVVAFRSHMPRASVYRARGSLHARVELDFTEGAFVIRHVLVQDRGQRLCLLRAQIDSLKITYLDLAFRVLLHGAENQEKVPHVDANLHAVGVGFTIVRSIYDIKIRLHRIDHTADSLAEADGKGNTIGLPAPGIWS